MTWFHVDDGFWGHPKLDGMTHGAIALWVVAGSWCARYLKDGVVPVDRVAKLGFGLDHANELVRAGLWAGLPSGFRFHDWDHYQETKDEVESKRDTWRVEKKRQRAAKAKRKVEMSGADSGPASAPASSPPLLSSPVLSPNGDINASLESPSAGDLPLQTVAADLEPVNGNDPQRRLNVGPPPGQPERREAKVKKPRVRTERDELFDAVVATFETAHKTAHTAPQGIRGQAAFVSKVVNWLLEDMPKAEREPTLKRAVAGFFLDPFWAKEGRHPFRNFAEQPGTYIKSARPVQSNVFRTSAI